MMRKWRISVQWEVEVDAEDEGTALIDADMQFNFMSEARSEEIEPEDSEGDSE
jgi:hypothetical protein